MKFTFACWVPHRTGATKIPPTQPPHWGFEPVRCFFKVHNISHRQYPLNVSKWVPNSTKQSARGVYYFSVPSFVGRLTWGTTLTSGKTKQYGLRGPFEMFRISTAPYSTIVSISLYIFVPRLWSPFRTQHRMAGERATSYLWCGHLVVGRLVLPGRRRRLPIQQCGRPAVRM